MNKLFNRVISVLICILLFLSTRTLAKSEINELNDKKQNATNNAENVKKDITNLNDKVKSVSNEIASLDKKLMEASDEIVRVENELVELDIKLIKMTEELKEAEEVLEQQKEAFGNRVNAMSKARDFSGLEILLSADNVSDFLSRQQILSQIAKQDKELVENLKEQRDLVDLKKLQIEEEKENAENQRKLLEDKKNELIKASKEKQDYMKNLQSDKKRLEAELDKFIKERKEYEAMILRLQSSSTKYSGGRMLWPVPGKTTISSPFGQRNHPILRKKKLHSGVDITAPSNTQVVAASDGIVIFSGWLGGYGNTVMIDHGGGIVTLYAHNNSLSVSKGQNIKRGNLISKVGSTGMSTGPHLHFEVRKNGKFEDPLPWLKGK